MADFGAGTVRTGRRKRGLALAAVFAAAGVAWAAAGDLDLSFGTDGIADVALPGDPNWVEVDCEIQSGGRIILAGSDEVNVPHMRWAIRGFTAAGAVDTSFGTDGMVTVFGAAADDWLHDITLDGSGRIVAVGRASTVTTSGNGKKTTQTTVVGPSLARITANGQLDTTFGSGGTVLTQVPGANGADARAVAVQPDGKIVVAGTASFTTKGKGGSRTQNALYLARYLSDGALDTTFGTGGITIHDRTTENDAPVLGNSIAIQSDGRIVLGSRSGASDFTDEWNLTRYLPNGALDASFEVSTVGDRLRAIAVDGDDRILGVGMRSLGLNATDMLVARYTADGVLDTSFGSDGATAMDIDDLDILIGQPRFQPDGKIVCAGIAQIAGSSFYDYGVLVRLNGDGTPDTDFGVTGVAGPIELSASQTEPWAAALAPDGGIVVGGRFWGSDSAIHWFLARFSAQ